MIKFTIPIVPVAQMRARHTARNGFAVAYKDKKQVAQEENLNTFLMHFVPTMPLDGQIMLGVRAYLPIPKSMAKNKREAAKKHILRPTTKPDLDNLLKHVKDCMTMMRFWGDDKQVVGYLPHTGKYYSENPRWEIEIVKINPDLYND